MYTSCVLQVYNQVVDDVYCDGGRAAALVLLSKFELWTCPWTNVFNQVYLSSLIFSWSVYFIDLAVLNSTFSTFQFVMKLTDNVGMDRICECTGVPPVVNSTFSMLRKGGHLCLVGLPKQPLHVDNVLQDVGQYRVCCWPHYRLLQCVMLSQHYRVCF